MNMASNRTRATLELMKAQLNYKRNLNRRLRRGYAKVKVGDYIWLDVQDYKANKNPGGHTDVPFVVLDRNTRRFVIELGEVVERLNGDPVG